MLRSLFSFTAASPVHSQPKPFQDSVFYSLEASSREDGAGRPIAAHVRKPPGAGDSETVTERASPLAQKEGSRSRVAQPPAWREGHSKEELPTPKCFHNCINDTRSKSS